MMRDYEHEQNVRRYKELTSEGFQLSFNHEGYTVKYLGKFIAGAGTVYYKAKDNTTFKRDKPKHYKHKEADRRNHLQSCVAAAEQYKKSLSADTKILQDAAI